MATFTKTLLSGSTNGKAIKVVATATAGTTIHTAVSGTASFDEVWLYAHNSSAASVKLTVEYGGVSAPTDVFGPPVNGSILVESVITNGTLLVNF